MPVHRVPAWLSSDEVKAAIGRVVEARGEAAKSFAWDMLSEVNKLVAAAPASERVERDG